MYFSKELIANSGTTSARNYNRQWAEVEQRRRFGNAQDEALARMAGNAAATIPRDVYLEMDMQTKTIMRADEGDAILNDLLPLAKGVDIGKIEYKYRQASDSGNAKTTLSGQTVVTMDKTDYKYDSAIIPVHQDGFGREWREYAGQRSEGFDALIDDQANSVRATRRQMVDYVLDGSNITFNGNSWSGIRNDSRVARVDLDSGGLNIDLTSSATTGAAMRVAFKSMRDTLRITNNAYGDATVYVSREIYTNLERHYNENDVGYGTILEDLLKLAGIGAIKESSKLSGNELFMAMLSSEFIQPLVGMGVNTIAIPRVNPFDAHNFITWGAMGIQVKNDYDGKTGVLYAAAFE
ncbi:MAG: major capsid protein [Thalassolituus sp.]